MGRRERIPDFQKMLEQNDWDMKRLEKKVEKIAKKLPQTTGITTGSGRLWYEFHKFKWKGDQ